MKMNIIILLETILIHTIYPILIKQTYMIIDITLKTIIYLLIIVYNNIIKNIEVLVLGRGK